MRQHTKTTRAILTAILTATPLLVAQSETKFEVAAVRLASDNASIDLSGGPGTSDPGRIRYILPMTMLLSRAYEVPQDLISGPGWLSTTKVSIVANVPPGSSKDQLKRMLQNLLIERFKLAAHLETRKQSGFELTVAKGGPKLKESDESPDSDEPARSLGADADGFPKLPAGAHTVGPVAIGTRSGIKASFGKTSMRELIQWLKFELESPVADTTGLTKRYDFKLQYASTKFGLADADVSAPYLPEAVEQQLGLKALRKNLTGPLFLLGLSKDTFPEPRTASASATA